MRRLVRRCVCVKRTRGANLLTISAVRSVDPSSTTEFRFPTLESPAQNAGQSLLDERFVMYVSISAVTNGFDTMTLHSSCSFPEPFHSIWPHGTKRTPVQRLHGAPVTAKGTVPGSNAQQTLGADTLLDSFQNLSTSLRVSFWCRLYCRESHYPAAAHQCAYIWKSRTHRRRYGPHR